MKIWFIEFPTYQYVEDVKKLAREKGFIIVDAKFQGTEKQCDNPPKLSLIGEKPKSVKKD